MSLLQARSAKVTGLFIFVALLAAMFLTACGGSGGTETSSAVRTKSLEIVDDNGATRMVLTTVQDGRPSVTLLDDKGDLRAMLFLGDGGAPNMVLIDNPRIALVDERGKIRSVQYLDEKDSPVLTQMDVNGVIRAMLRLDENGAATADLYDASSKSVWKAP